MATVGVDGLTELQRWWYTCNMLCWRATHTHTEIS